MGTGLPGPLSCGCYVAILFVVTFVLATTALVVPLLSQTENKALRILAAASIGLVLLFAPLTQVFAVFYVLWSPQASITNNIFLVLVLSLAQLTFVPCCWHCCCCCECFFCCWLYRKAKGPEESVGEPVSAPDPQATQQDEGQGEEKSKEYPARGPSDAGEKLVATSSQQDAHDAEEEEDSPCSFCCVPFAPLRRGYFWFFLAIHLYGVVMCPAVILYIYHHGASPKVKLKRGDVDPQAPGGKE